MCNYTLIGKEQRKARKPHRCIWCGEQIVIGETYEHERCVFEGDPQSNDWHLECVAAMGLEMQQEPGGCIEFTPWAAERPASSYR